MKSSGRLLAAVLLLGGGVETLSAQTIDIPQSWLRYLNMALVEEAGPSRRLLTLLALEPGPRKNLQALYHGFPERLAEAMRPEIEAIQVEGSRVSFRLGPAARAAAKTAIEEFERDQAAILADRQALLQALRPGPEEASDRLLVALLGDQALRLLRPNLGSHVAVSVDVLQVEQDEAGEWNLLYERLASDGESLLKGSDGGGEVEPLLRAIFQQLGGKLRTAGRKTSPPAGF